MRGAYFQYSEDQGLLSYLHLIDIEITKMAMESAWPNDFTL